MRNAYRKIRTTPTLSFGKIIQLLKETLPGIFRDSFRLSHFNPAGGDNEAISWFSNIYGIAELSEVIKLRHRRTAVVSATPLLCNNVCLLYLDLVLMI